MLISCDKTTVNNDSSSSDSTQASETEQNDTNNNAQDNIQDYSDIQDHCENNDEGTKTKDSKESPLEDYDDGGDWHGKID